MAYSVLVALLTCQPMCGVSSNVFSSCSAPPHKSCHEFHWCSGYSVSESVFHSIDEIDRHRLAWQFGNVGSTDDEICAFSFVGVWKELGDPSIKFCSATSAVRSDNFINRDLCDHTSPKLLIRFALGCLDKLFKYGNEFFTPPS